MAQLHHLVGTDVSQRWQGGQRQQSAGEVHTKVPQCPSIPTGPTLSGRLAEIRKLKDTVDTVNWTVVIQAQVVTRSCGSFP